MGRIPSPTMGTLSPCQGGLPPLNPPWGTCPWQEGGSHSPGAAGLEGSCCTSQGSAALLWDRLLLQGSATCSDSPTKHGLGGGKWKRDPTRAPLMGRNLLFGRMRTYMEVFPTQTFTKTLSPPSTAANLCPCHKKVCTAQPKEFHWQ